MDQSVIRKLFSVATRAVRKISEQPRDAILSARMALWVVLVTLLANLTSLQRTQKIAAFSLRSASLGRGSETPPKLKQTIDGILGLDLFVFRRTCWKRALVLHRFLLLNGIESRINFGLRKEIDGKIHGHAWLEHEGQPLLEDEVGNYVVTFSLPPKPAVFLPASS